MLISSVKEKYPAKTNVEWGKNRWGRVHKKIRLIIPFINITAFPFLCEVKRNIKSDAFTQNKMFLLVVPATWMDGYHAF